MLYTLPYISSLMGILFASFFVHSLYRQSNRLASLFALNWLFMAIYTFGFGMELISDNIKDINFFITLEYFGISFLPMTWFLLGYKFFYNKLPNLIYSFLLGIVSALFLFAVVTNEYHHLYYTNLSVGEIGGLHYGYAEKNILFYLFSVFSSLLLTAGIRYFFIAWKREKFNINTPCFWILVGVAVPFLVGILSLTGLNKYKFDFMPFSFLSVGIFGTITLFKYDFLEIRSFVREYTFGQINEGILVLDNQNRIIDYNTAGSKIFSWLNPTNIGKNIKDFEEGRNIVESIGNDFEAELCFYKESRYFSFKISEIQESGKTVGKVFLFQDITEQKFAIERLNYLATHDSLSGVYNRNRLLEEIENALNHAKKYGEVFSILMLDIDHFKGVNDRHGHIMGDLVIKVVGEYCKSELKGKGIIGRYGGEEFIIILPQTDKEQAGKIAERIRCGIEALEIKTEDKQISITVSIGVVFIGEDRSSATVNSIISAVDAALYAAKNSGRNAVCAIYNENN